jgi:hypothetical protein
VRTGWITDINCLPFFELFNLFPSLSVSLFSFFLLLFLLLLFLCVCRRVLKESHGRLSASLDICSALGNFRLSHFFSFRNAFQFQNLVFITARNESEGVFRFSLGKFESLTSCCCYCCWCYGFERFLTVVVEEAVLGEGEPSLLP